MFLRSSEPGKGWNFFHILVFANLTSYPDMIPPSHISSSAYLHTVPVTE